LQIVFKKVRGEQMLKKNEGSIIIETAIIMQLCIMCVLGLIGMTVKYHYSITNDLYSDIHGYYSSDTLPKSDEVDRIKKIQQLKFIDDIADQVLISSVIKQKYEKGLKKIQLILE